MHTNCGFNRYPCLCTYVCMYQVTKYVCKKSYAHIKYFNFTQPVVKLQFQNVSLNLCGLNFQFNM